MRINGKQPVVLLALNRAGQDADLLALKNAGVKTVQCGSGCFEGQTELCYAIPTEEFTVEVRDLLRRCQQRAVFFLDNQYNAWLATVENDYTGYAAHGPKRAVYVGEFREVNEIQAKRSKGYSYFGGKWYVAGK
jgi:hypothetical protein